MLTSLDIFTIAVFKAPVLVRISVIYAFLTRSHFRYPWQNLSNLCEIVPKLLPLWQNNSYKGHLMPDLLISSGKKSSRSTLFEVNQPLKQTISGFRKGHSTTTVLLRIRDDIIRAMKKGELTLMVLADYSKAFDTVSYSVIIQKMYKMGFSKPFLSWMTYLCDRRQYVQIDDKKSTLERLQFGVPQGSILGPLLFKSILRICRTTSI